MSQSELHRSLVIRVANALEARYPRILIATDLQRRPGDPVPPLICGYRPDVYATNTSRELVVIADAKTESDIDRAHTDDQLASFVGFLERRNRGVFVLSVSGSGADHAKTVLFFAHRRVRVRRTEFAIFDGCDFWSLDPGGSVRWRLS